MAKVQVLILRTAGTNCDHELAYAFALAGAEPTLVHINELVAGTRQLNEFQILGFPGGFSYGDDIAAGRIHATEVRSYLTEELAAFAREGKCIIGICNGFQVLINARLLPGDDLLGDSQDVSLAGNAGNRFECRWLHLQGASSNCVWFPEERRIELPVAHAEGRFVTRNADVLKRICDNGQVAFRYVDAEGRRGDYPVNPNGSQDDIAGICDPTGRILGLMPHPERFVRAQSHPTWTRRPEREYGDGLLLFQQGVQFVENNL